MQQILCEILRKTESLYLTLALDFLYLSMLVLESANQLVFSGTSYKLTLSTKKSTKGAGPRMPNFTEVKAVTEVKIQYYLHLTTENLYEKLLLFCL